MKNPLVRYILFLIFFISGFTGLIYESLWSHYLKLFLGHSAYAQTLVLMIFMGGLASGAAIVGKTSWRLKNLLAGYAIAEIGIGLLALFFHPLFTTFIDLSYTLVMPGLDSPVMVETYKWGVAILLLMPPSMLLGTTFPLMSGAILRRFPGVEGGNLAMLYFSNSIGAALGVLVASFVLINLLGLPGTLQLAGVINLLIGVSVLYFSRVPEVSPSKVVTSAESKARNFRILFIAAAFITGVASFIYEVGWIRMLSLVLGSSFHAFELMLSAFITGLALGSLAISRYIDRINNPIAVAAAIQIAMGVFAVITLPVYVYSFGWMGELVNTLAKDDQGYTLFNLASHGIAFAVMLPATFMAGMTLPLFTHVLIRNGHGEQSIGAVYAANTVGGIIGVVMAMHFALPNMGLKLTLVGGALLDIGLGLILFRVVGASPGRWAVALAALAVPVLTVQLVEMDGSLLGSGVYRTGVSQIKDSRVLFYREGKTASISVLGFNSKVSIRTNGKSDAAIEMNPQYDASGDEITMVMAAAVPLAMKPDARSAANIGFGSGLTAHTLLADPDIVDLHTIEIERAIIDGARFFLPRVDRAYNDPRSHINIEDAKSWFARHNRGFDIIISEPSNPWVSGVSSLFSDEFYERIRNYLNEDGLLVQWLNLYEFDARLVSSVIMALNRHFSDYGIYSTDDTNILILATRNGKLPLLSERIFELGTMSGELERVGIRTLDDFHFRRLGDASMFNSMLGSLSAPINSDYFPYVELNAPKARFFKSVAMEFPQMGIYHLPLIEMLDHQKHNWKAEQLTPTESMRYMKVNKAQSIKAALLRFPVQDEKVAERVESWRNMLKDCTQNAHEKTLAAMHEIALLTLAYLDKDNLQALWMKPSWLSCASPKIKSRLVVYQAVANRDASAMLASAESALLDEQGSIEWHRYVFDVALIAARVLGNESIIESLWGKYGRKLYSDGKMSPELVLLLSYKSEFR